MDGRNIYCFFAPRFGSTANGGQRCRKVWMAVAVGFKAPKHALEPRMLAPSFDGVGMSRSCGNSGGKRMTGDPRSPRPRADTCSVMGIVNVTPDSFSGDGLGAHADPVEAALRQATDFLAAGATILDIGGESTRPGSEPLAAEEEMNRVLPVVEAIAARFPDALISVDTYKADVAREAAARGARMLNDVWAGTADPAMLPLAAETGLPIVLMHNRAQWGRAAHDPRHGGAYDAAEYGDFVEDLLRDLTEIVERALAAGVSPGNIVLDPGIGFGKTVDQNLAIIRETPRLRDLGYPVLLGPSRKNFIGKVLEAEKADRLVGTAATVAIGAYLGADIVRVHDVREMVQTVKMVHALRHGLTGA